MMISAAYVLLWTTLIAYLAHSRRPGHLTGRIATALAAATWLMLTAALAQRACAAGHWPLTNRYEFALVLTWSILALHLLFEIGNGEQRFGSYVTAIGLLIATWAVSRPAGDKIIYPLVPALRSGWLPIHGISAMIGYGACGVAAGVGLFCLRSSTLQPTAERALNRLLALAFPWLTLGLLTGAIWAQQAWGRYWNWDPKETWSLVVWLWYLLILHLRPMRRWQGRRLAVLVILGFGLIIFNFIGLPWLIRSIRGESLHGF